MSCKIRCIGGTKDGEEINWNGYNECVVPILDKPLSYTNSYEECYPEKASIHTERYRLEKFVDHGDTFYLLIHEDLTPDEALDRYLNFV